MACRDSLRKIVSLVGNTTREKLHHGVHHGSTMGPSTIATSRVSASGNVFKAAIPTAEEATANRNGAMVFVRFTYFEVSAGSCFLNKESNVL